MKLLRYMIKEEWRIHSTLFGSARFAMFPIVIMAGTALFSVLILLFDVFFSRGDMLIFAFYMFFFFGANVGAFGIAGREFMNRRFGQASLIAYSSKTLPISEREIFATFIIKDIAYYFILWIIPIILGFAMVSQFIGISIAVVPMLLLTISTAFLLGLSIVFFLSMLYARSLSILIAALALIAAAFLRISPGHLLMSMPLSIMHADVATIILSATIIIVLCSISIIFAKLDFPVRKKEHANLLEPFNRFFALSKSYSVYISKDMIDLLRSNGGIGKVIFSFIVPVSFSWIFVAFVKGYMPGIGFLILFSSFLGIFSATIYNWITDYDLYSQYTHLPIRVSTLIKSKLLGYAFINILSVAILVIAGIAKHEMMLLAPAIVVFAISSLFALSATILYTGLAPSIRFTDAKVMIKYLATLIPLMALWISSYFFGIAYMIIGGIILLILSVYMMKVAFRKWESAETGMF